MAKVYHGVDDEGTKFVISPRDSREVLLAQRMASEGKSQTDIAYALGQMRQNIEGRSVN